MVGLQTMSFRARVIQCLTNIKKNLFLLSMTEELNLMIFKDKRLESFMNLALYSQRGLAKLYGVSRRLIVFILDPLKHQANIARKQELLKTKSYYDKDKQRAYMRSHRQYKQQLYLDNKLIDKSLEPEQVDFYLK